MLRYLQVKHLAVIDEVELEFDGGMTVFTGETGAGKSILIEALGLALGDRAESSMVRAGCEQASISAIFDPLPDTAFATLLEQHGIEREEELVIKRQVGSDGRSRAFVNGSPVPLTVLRAIGERLADIHGQHEHHSLLRRDAQRGLLDEFGHHEQLLDAVGSAHARLRVLQQRLVQLEGASGNAEGEADLLRYQVSELKALQPTPEGIAALEEEHRRLANAGRLAEGCGQILDLLSDAEDNAQVMADRAAREVNALARLDARFAEVAAMLEAASIQLGEAALWLRHYAGGMDADPERVEQIEQRLAALHDLARKHRVPAPELPAQLARLEQRLYELEHGAELREQVRRDLETALQEYDEAATRLHEARVQTAKKLAAAVTRNMHELGMPGGKFAVGVESPGAAARTAHGSDRVEFEVTANPGQPMRPLNKVASGGELSRISLAIQVLSAKGKRVPSFVFDEVDVGIGGRVAEIVGRMLRDLGGDGQVLCVTHLPQVAALGHQHIRIEKAVDDGTTRIEASSLGSEARVEELARMLGGVTITKQTVAHARAMLEASATG
ncbi:MAG: DNA repair protein RecN [Gammaproteobacteria bacterium]|nr:DNA repair protein RecN [Gammaproteobacteria bacterium]MCG3142982.1 DNA repair protein RecN [Gammaproteobacteria bacterium]